MRALTLALGMSLAACGPLLAQGTDPKDAEIRTLKLMVELQTKQIEALKAEVARGAGEATTAKTPSSRPAGTQPSRPQVSADAALKRVLEKVEFTGKPLGDAVNELRELLHISILVKWPALEAAGIDKKTPVNFKLSNTTGEKVIRTLLEDVGGTTPLGYEVREGVLVLSTREDLDKLMVTRSYDVSGLIAAGGAGLSRAQAVDALVRTVKTNVSPRDWAPEGAGASIVVTGNNLVLTAPDRIHRAVAQLLVELRSRAGGR